MVVYQFVHQLNNTELGRTGTHDCYAYVSRDSAPMLSFLEIDSHNKFVYKRDPSIVGDLFYTHTSTGEYRISGCKRFFDAGKVNAGDCIVIERVNENFWVDFIRRDDIIVFNRVNGGWQCRNEDRLAKHLSAGVHAYYNSKLGILAVKYERTIAKRTQTIKVYSLTFNGTVISDGDIYNIFNVGGVCCVTPVFKDKLMTTYWSDYE